MIYFLPFIELNFTISGVMQIHFHITEFNPMTELLNSYTFEAKKIVYYSVTVGADNKTEAKRIASDFEHCQHYEEVERCDGYEYKVGKMLETTDEKWLS